MKWLRTEMHIRGKVRYHIAFWWEADLVRAAKLKANKHKAQKRARTGRR